MGIVALVATTGAFAITASESQLAHAETLDQRPEARAQAPAEATQRVQAAPPVVVDRSAKISRTDERPSRAKIVPAPPEPKPEPPSDTGATGADASAGEEADGAAAGPLAGCDVEVGTGFANGQVPSDQLCAPWEGAQEIRADAARSLAALNEAYTARFGESMCLADGYRSYDQQVATKAAKGYLAAQPGYSNHGWGLAVDLCAETYAGERWDWLAEQAQDSGWDNPDWARPGGSKYEPWHWEFTDAVAEQS
ncbi:M15 family metallopeptidase [Isoptericola sp. NPDC019482]|uniref:M15 family metallopeptidase n=1 Tax=Isoptericola sp. NPDC019482 TaxID=3154688 RepID=UPI00349752EA